MERVLMKENEIIKKIEENLRAYKESQTNEPKGLDSKWEFLVSKEPSRFINRDNMTVKAEALRDFRKMCIFIPDTPEFNASPFDLRSHLSGGRRGGKKLLKESLEVIVRHGYEDLLRKHPTNSVGNPNLFKYKGHIYTYRWLKHIYSLGIMKKHLEDKLPDDFITLDIGSSYGIFSYLLKKEFPRCKCILLDFPEQLILAHYYLGMSFPDAKIATYKDIVNLAVLDRGLFDKYDFVLIPWFLYKNITPKSIDLVTNFASFGEMKREWFDYYTKSEPFLSSKYFLTANRFQSAPTYDTDLTILDYPLSDFQKLHFGISPIFTHTYVRKMLFFYEKLMFSSQYFEFIGER